MRTRRKKSEMPFAEALEAATKRLKHAQKEREGAVWHLLHLDSEIPALQRTIQALEQQLGNKRTITVDTSPVYTPEHVRTGTPHVFIDGPFTKDIPAGVLAQLPKDYLEPVVDVPDDTLPEITGTPLIPEK